MPATMVRAKRAHSRPSFIFMARMTWAAARTSATSTSSSTRMPNGGRDRNEDKGPEEADDSAEQAQQAADEPDPIGDLQLGGHPGDGEHAGQAAPGGVTSLKFLGRSRWHLEAHPARVPGRPVWYGGLAVARLAEPGTRAAGSPGRRAIVPPSGHLRVRLRGAEPAGRNVAGLRGRGHPAAAAAVHHQGCSWLPL